MNLYAYCRIRVAVMHAMELQASKLGLSLKNDGLGYHCRCCYPNDWLGILGQTGRSPSPAEAISLPLPCPCSHKVRTRRSRSSARLQESVKSQIISGLRQLKNGPVRKALLSPLHHPLSNVADQALVVSTWEEKTTMSPYLIHALHED